jgi:hypothetical protein
VKVWRGSGLVGKGRVKESCTTQGYGQDSQNRRTQGWSLGGCGRRREVVTDEER